MQVLPRNLGWSQKASGALRFLAARLAGYPTLVNLEVTRRCNALCDFCRYPATRSERTLDTYVPVIRKLKASAVVFTGGEPLLRRDLEHLIRSAREAYPAIFLGLVTNGALLTVERGVRLWNAGLDQMTVSLDFLDGRHDLARGIPGLTQRILDTVPRLTAAGIDNLVLQAVIKSESIDSISGIIEWAGDHGARVSLSAYTAAKNGNDGHLPSASQWPALRRMLDEVLALRKKNGRIVSSTYYLGRIPEYFENGSIGQCPAGRRFVTVDPAGNVYRCSESTESCFYEEWKPGRFGPYDCGSCWVPCRGESQAPVNWERIMQVVAVYGKRDRGRGRPSFPVSPASAAGGPPVTPGTTRI